MRNKFIDALFPKTRQQVLAATVLQPTKWWYLSDLAKWLEVTPSTLQRELANLTEAEILEAKKEGNRVYYKVNLSCPIVNDLQSLFVKTSGVADVISEKLKKFSKKIDFAFIYGSMARFEDLSKSDIDLMIIGDVKLMDFTSAIKQLEETLGREVNTTIYSRKEFLKSKETGFIKTVLKNKKIFLIGTEDELTEMAG